MENETNPSFQSNGQYCSKTPKDNSQYREQIYWEKRFQTEDQYEWLCTYNDLQDYIKRDLKEEDKIIILGCGNSTFSSDLCDAGFSNVTSVDFSTAVINAMRKKYESCHPNPGAQCGKKLMSLKKVYVIRGVSLMSFTNLFRKLYIYVTPKSLCHPVKTHDIKKKAAQCAAQTDSLFL